MPTPEPLSRQRILSCALAVADQGGIDATSLRKVANKLGVHVTSLYNHVPTKEALLDGVVEELFASVELPVGDHAWEDWVRRFVDAVTEMARKHPGGFGVLLRRPVQGAEATATFEAGLAAFHRAGMDAPECYAAVKTVALGVLGACIEQADFAAGTGLSTDVTSLPAEDFPMLHEVARTAEDIDVLEALREVLVAGLAQRIAAKR